ncbi:hypothetical protein PB1_16429 [Bacillus methanolicus PB1]|uniref:Uncharacterized protein n=1 Tax=Bacillus methanolicus PB1 TaxID=997296 RepID=I3DY40_BACMT|nr:hypothetical protein [Bacillus methanolicus]EIJ79161.1 hypothetical protein PB1_16429 [Bacillus methanolicus PB1]
MIGKEAYYKVLLPEWIWKEAKTKEEVKRLVLQYMRHYPHYVVKKVKDGFAVCERK